MREVHYSPELEWMHTEEHQPESAAGCGGPGTDDATLTELVEPSSFTAAAGDRLLVHLSSFGTAYPGDIQATLASSNVRVDELERLVKEFCFKEKGSTKT